MSVQLGCLLGEYEEPEKERGAIASLSDRGEVIGNALRTQSGINPIFVSIGHRISLAASCEWVLKVAPKYRLPQTTRLADQAVRSALKI